MTPEELEAIEARAAAATPGPWRQARYGGVETADGNTLIFQAHDLAQFVEADEIFTAHARTDIPVLIAEIRRLRDNFGTEEARASWIRERLQDAEKRTETAETKIRKLEDEMRLLRDDRDRWYIRATAHLQAVEASELRIKELESHEP